MGCHLWGRTELCKWHYCIVLLCLSIIQSEAYKYDTASVALADASRFESQLESYRHLPGMFKLRTYLDFLENDCSDIRKYIISNEIDVRNLVLNLEEKPSLDLLNTDINLLTNPK